MAGAKISLPDFVDSDWFKLLSRGAMVLAAALSSYIALNVYGTQSKLAGVESVQIERAQDGERFQSYVKTKVDDIEAALEGQDDRLIVLQTDTAMMKGILQEMQRQDVAERRILVEGIVP